jgi:osmotically-inducible protein OsmY
MRAGSLIVVLLTIFCFTACASAVRKAGANSTTDRRTASTIIEDNAIESKSNDQIEAIYQATVHVNITSFNRFVLITGEVPTDEIKTQVARMVSSMPNIKGYANELSVGALSKYSSRSSDAFISSNIKSLLNKSTKVPTSQVRITTENGFVYLMGLTTHAEADAASDIASTVRDVKKVLRIFEYIN